MRCFVVEFPRTRFRRAAGITLIETLFASTLGAGLLIVLLHLYQGGMAMHALAESRAELAETTFIAERIVADELRHAGQLPCGPHGTRHNLVRAHHTTPWLRLFAEPVQLAAGGVPGSDELTVLKTGAPVAVVDHDPARAELTLTHAADFERGDLAVVCDDDVTVLLQITDDGGRTLGYGHDARVRPGNCALPFIAGGCGPENHRFKPGALAAPYEPVVFFTRDLGTRHSLYRKRLALRNSGGNRIASLRSEEIIEGIPLLRASVGIVDASGRVSLTRGPVSTGQAVIIDVGLAAIARGNNTGGRPRAPLHLLGEPIDMIAGNRLLSTHEFSVAL